MNIKNYLDSVDLTPGLREVVLCLVDSIKNIAKEIRVSDGSVAGSMNSSGDDQLKMDVLADEIIMEHLKACDSAGLVASEEQEDEVLVGDGKYAVAHDPLDGSSLLDVNFAVGTIVGVYETDTFIGVRGDDQRAVMLGVYGPSTGIFISVGEGLQYFVMNNDGEFELRKENIKIDDSGKTFAPGNLRAAAENESYRGLIDYWMAEQYKLRYSGGFVPDCGHIFLKGKGIFTYPAYSEMPNGKLRLLFEVAPMAYLMEAAGGMASDGSTRILDKELKELHQRTEVFLGSREEVKKAISYFK